MEELYQNNLRNIIRWDMKSIGRTRKMKRDYKRRFMVQMAPLRHPDPEVQTATVERSAHGGDPGRPGI